MAVDKTCYHPTCFFRDSKFNYCGEFKGVCPNQRKTPPLVLKRLKIARSRCCGAPIDHSKIDRPGGVRFNYCHACKKMIGKPYNPHKKNFKNHYHKHKKIEKMLPTPLPPDAELYMVVSAKTAELINTNQKRKVKNGARKPV